MTVNTKMRSWIFIVIFSAPLFCFASTAVKTMIVFGDSISDTGNTAHLLKSLRKEESPAYLVQPLKVFVIHKMVAFANDYYIPQIVLDAGISQVTEFFDFQLAPMLADLVGKVRKVPVIPQKPYWNYRFSNGRIWFEYLAPMLNIDKEENEHYANRAFGGSWAMSYNQQLTVWNFIKHPLLTLKSLINGKLIPPSLGLIVQGYLLEHPEADDEALYFLFSGNNDYLNALIFEDTYNQDIMNLYINNVLNDLSASVKKLAGKGAKHFVILGLPHIGSSPHFNQSSDGSIIDAAVDKHNQGLQSLVTEWQKELSIDVIYIDTQTMFNKALNDPQRYGFTNIRDACIDVKLPMFQLVANRSPFPGNFVMQYAEVLQYRHKDFALSETNYHVCDYPEQYLFWDEVHPTTRAHHYLAYEICKSLTRHGYETDCKMPA